jgi:hypothetical protein
MDSVQSEDPMRITTLILLLFLLAPPGFTADKPTDRTFAEVDFAKVDRKIAKEPKYVASPLYALFLFGPKGETKVWAVLDKSEKRLGWYDVLYFDRNADGDLTDPKECFRGKYRPEMARAGMAMTIPVGDFLVPGTNERMSAIRVSTIRKTGRKGIWFTMKWRGKETISGGSTKTGMDSTTWAKSPAKAPILRPTAEGPLSFAIWGGPKVPVLRIGASTRISFTVGNPGSGPDTLCYLDDKFLTPGKDRIFATLIAKDRKGKRIETRSEIKKKPC